MRRRILFVVGSVAAALLIFVGWRIAFGVSDLARAVLRRDTAETKRLLDAGGDADASTARLLVQYYGPMYPGDPWSQVQDRLAGAFYIGPPPVTLLELAGDPWWGEVDWGLVRLLIERGADVQGEPGWHVFRHVMFQDRALAEVMLTRGFSLNGFYHGTTPLHYAASAGDRSVVEFLLEHGSDASLVGASGKTAADWARDKGRMELAEFLEQSAQAPAATNP